MKRLSLALLLFTLAACAADGGLRRDSRTAEPSAGSSDARLNELEARLIGLTEELDRLGRRVASLEGGSVAPPAVEETAPAPVPEVPAPEEEPVTAGEFTGLLIDARRLVDSPLPSTRYDRFRITDASGVAIFTSADFDPQLIRTRPIFWVADPEADLGPAALPLLGANPMRLDAAAAELVLDGEEPVAVISLGEDDAKKLRGLTGLGKMIEAGNLAILLRAEEE